MSSIDECAVLIPAATLEDFPTEASDYDARSLLAAWTVLWHPKLLARCRQVPTWYRADSPPDPVGGRLLTVPHSSLGQLPGGYQEKCQQADDCQWITGSDRKELLASLDLAEPIAEIRGRARSIGVEDFFAAGYAVLQVQVMTRRLRYTSNLDEIHLQNRVVSAAESFLDGKAEAAIEALHDVFDCLAEERDHYFASDPHLIDLNLTTDTTIASLDRLVVVGKHGSLGPHDAEESHEKHLADKDAAKSESADSSSTSMSEQDSQPAPLPTPANVLLDGAVVRALAGAEPELRESVRQALGSKQLGWAGGGPPADEPLDEMTLAQAEQVLEECHREAERVLGIAPRVYARFSGGTPGDLTPAVVRLGYEGLIPLDFAGGKGFGDEAKVILRAGGVEIESLTAKPMDANSDSAFLSLGPKLGEAIDGGEIATALLAHWPDNTCDSFNDLRRVASWCLALGRFWKLDDYFTEGEQPYHHGNTRAASPGADRHLRDQVDEGTADPLSQTAAKFRETLTLETDAKLRGLAALVRKVPSEKDEASDGEGAAAKQVATALGASPRQAAPTGSGPDDTVLLINPHESGSRETLPIAGNLATTGDQIYGVHRSGNSSVATIDVPAGGFALLQGAGITSSSGKRGWFSRRPKPIAEAQSLLNEFMEVTIHAESGGIAGVYSGGTRGNRFSMRLVRGDSESSLVTMHAETIETVESDAGSGTIRSAGELRGADGKAVASFKLDYTLRRGSRVLQVRGCLTPSTSLGTDPWHDYFAARAAVATEAANFRQLLRDKIHRPRGRHLVAPLGVLIDEAERQTLVSADGLPCHSRVGDRFLDTLLRVKGETSGEFTLNYGFDVSHPVAAAKSLLVPASRVAVDSAAAPLGWLLHVTPKDVIVTSLDLRTRADGKLAAILRVVHARPKSCNAILRLVHPVSWAAAVSRSDAAAFDTPMGDGPGVIPLECKGDRITLPMVGHQVSDILVVLET